MTLKLEDSIRDRLAAEHAELWQQLGELREWWSEIRELGIPHFGEMGSRLTPFREHLAAHLQHEEASQFFDVMRQRHLDRSEEVRRLQDEHVELLRALDELIRRLQTDEPEFSTWGEAGQSFESFLDQMHRHEQLERELGEESAPPATES